MFSAEDLSELDPDARRVEVAYVYTAVSEFGEEGPPSPATAVITTTDGHPIEVTMPTPTFISADRALGTGAKKRLYRANAGSESAAFQFVIQQDISDTEMYVDDKRAFELGEALPSLGWTPPPDDDATLSPEGPLQGLVSMPGGILAGHTKRSIHFCVPGLPHAWPVEFRVTIERDIVALAPVPGGLAVLTDGRPYLINGTEPGALAPTRIEFPQGCLSARSVVDMGDYSFYCAPDGLARIDGAGARLVSRAYLSPDQWMNTFQGQHLQGFYWEGAAVYLPDDNSAQGMGFIYDTETDGFVFLTAECGGGWADPKDGSLYLIQGAEIKRYGRGVDIPLATWKSHPVRLPQVVSFNTGYISFGNTVDDRGQVELAIKSDTQVYRLRITIPDDNQVHFAEISSTGAVTRDLYTVSLRREPTTFRIPTMPGSEWSVEIESQTIVRSVHLTDDPLEVAAIQG